MEGLETAGIVVGAFSAGLDLYTAISSVATQTSEYIGIYGRIGVVLPWIATSDIWHLANDVLQSENDDVALRFVDGKVQEANMVGVTVCNHHFELIKDILTITMAPLLHKLQ